MSDDPRLKIAVFLPALQQGGAERVTVELANGLAALGRSVDIVTMNSSDGPLRPLVNPGVGCVPLGAKSFRSAVLKLARYYDRARPDIVLGTLYMNDVAAVLARFFSTHKPKLVAGAHNSLRHKIRHPDNRKDRYLLGPLARLLLPRADCLVGVSEGVTDEVREMVGMDARKCRTIHNPVYRPEIDEWAKRPADHPWLAADRDWPLILSVGRLVPQKGLFDLIEALKLVREALPVRLLVVGDGPLRGALETRAAELGIGDHMSFAGTKANPFNYMARADLFVLSSHWEGLANTIIEALAVGCPVVATDCDFGPREILAGGEFGTLVRPRDPRSLADGILRALRARDSTASREARIGRARKFSTSDAVAAYDRLFTSLAGRSV